MERFLLLLDNVQIGHNPTQLELLLAIEVTVEPHSFRQGVHSGAVVDNARVAQALYNTRRNAKCHGRWWNVPRNDTTSPDHGAVADSDTASALVSFIRQHQTIDSNLQDGDIGTDPHMIPNLDGLPDAALLPS